MDVAKACCLPAVLSVCYFFRLSTYMMAGIAMPAAMIEIIQYGNWSKTDALVTVMDLVYVSEISPALSLIW